MANIYVPKVILFAYFFTLQMYTIRYINDPIQQHLYFHLCFSHKKRDGAEYASSAAHLFEIIFVIYHL